MVVNIDLCKINRPIKILTACTKILKHRDTVNEAIFLNWDSYIIPNSVLSFMTEYFNAK